MKKIFFICSSSHYLNFLKEIFQILEDNIGNIEIRYIHFDSINAPDRKINENYKSIKIHDFIKTYKTLDIYNFLRKERPDKIVILEKGSLLERSILLASNKLGVVSIHIQEGCVPDISMTQLQNKNEKQRVVGGNMSLLNILKQIRKVVLLYLIYTIIYNHINKFSLLNRNFLKYSWYVFKNPIYHSWYQRSEVRATEAFCFGKKDLEYFSKIDGYTSKEVTAIGKPEFYNLIKKKKIWDENNAFRNIDLDIRNKYSIPLKTPVALLISQYFLESHGFEDFTLDAKLKHIEELYECISGAGYIFIDKLHPREDQNILRKHFAKHKGIYFLKDCDLNKIIYISDIILGYSSTALINAVILNKHPLIIDWMPKYFFDLPYYKVGTNASSIDDLRDKIKMAESGQIKTSEKDYRTFYDYFINVDMSNPPLSRIISAILD
jgi:hypothetical protein|tara:strand:+ start:267 stop:1574 length:1308 start_codon:yes stop_codon:yes gene_type:complete